MIQSKSPARTPCSTILQGQIHTRSCYDFIGGDFAEAQHHEALPFPVFPCDSRNDNTRVAAIGDDRRGTDAYYVASQQVHTRAGR
jgi:hypothetical protein